MKKPNNQQNLQNLTKLPNQDLFQSLSDEEMSLIQGGGGKSKGGKTQTTTETSGVYFDYICGSLS